MTINLAAFMPLLVLFILLLSAHAICDYPLQGDFLARAKYGTVEGFPKWLGLLVHAWIHATGVMLVTGNLLAGGIELVAHYVIDLLKTQRRFGIVIDQGLHVATKLVLVYLRARGRL